MTHPSSESLHVWAAKQFEVEANASPAEVRSAILRALADDDFMPEESRQAALNVLGERIGVEAQSALGCRVLQGDEDQLAERIEDYGRRFFELEPFERRQRHAGLLTEAAGQPRLLARLKALEDGLDVVLHTERLDGDARTLADSFCKLFVLRPIAAARRRQELLRECFRQDPPRWRDAAKLLKEKCSALAALEDSSVDKLLNGPRQKIAFMGPLRRLRGNIREQYEKMSLEIESDRTSNICKEIRAILTLGLARLARSALQKLRGELAAMTRGLVFCLVVFSCNALVSYMRDDSPPASQSKTAPTWDDDLKQFVVPDEHNPGQKKRWIALEEMPMEPSGPVRQHELSMEKNKNAKTVSKPLAPEVVAPPPRKPPE